VGPQAKQSLSQTIPTPHGLTPDAALLQVERLAPKALQDTRPPQHNALALISIARDISAAHGPVF
jgi:hypothetical protein